VRIKMAGAAVLVLIAVAVVLPSPYDKAKQVQPGGVLLDGSNADPATLALLRRACMNCHSNETQWPWYSKVAPVSWMVERDVLNGRKFMNLSWWPDYGSEGQSQILKLIPRQIEEGKMPPSHYRAIHQEARLTRDEKNSLAYWSEQEAQRLENQQH
jgi:hypothetical protein